MKAICIVEPGRVEIRDIEKPVRKPGRRFSSCFTAASAEAIWDPIAEEMHTFPIREFRDMSSLPKSWRSTTTIWASSRA